jgi:hypothetical protein
LIKANANLNVLDGFGHSALFMTLLHDNEDIWNLLKKSGAHYFAEGKLLKI